ncbi:MAG: hypothetical protein DMG22_19580 [Acidobacteria bacterium]|nr:MAG: hypothetical protein DMG22_19580 [Acidobacteriota bacterium]
MSTQEFDFLLFDPARLPQAGHFLFVGAWRGSTSFTVPTLHSFRISLKKKWRLSLPKDAVAPQFPEGPTEAM